MENDTFTTTGVTGLAMMVGQLRAELDRLRDDHDQLRAAFTDFQTERNDRERLIFDVVAKLDNTVEKITANANGTNPAGQTTDDDLEPLPTLNAGERAADYHKRVATWEKENGEEEPPKPPTGPVANSRAYAAKVARFYEAV